MSLLRADRVSRWQAWLVFCIDPLALTAAETAMMDARQDVVLILNAESGLLRAATDALERGGFRVLVANGLGTALTRSREDRPALVVIDHTFTSFEQEAYAGTLHAVYPEIRVLCLDGPIRQPDLLVVECHQKLNGPPTKRLRGPRRLGKGSHAED